MKKKLFVLLLLTSSIVYSQKEKSSKMGQTTLKELKMTVYDKDSTAAAVVLYEHANRYPDRDNDEKPRTDYYFRIKILNKTSFDLANVVINLYKEQEVKDIQAITYNIGDIGGLEKKHLLKKNIFTVKENKDWESKKFTLPDIK